MRSVLGHPLAAGLLVFVLTATAYLRAPGSPFQYDDHSAIVDLVPFLDPGEVLRIWSGFPAGRPLTQTALALDAWRSGMGPEAAHDFHVTNLLLHLIAAGLVYRLALKVFPGRALAATGSALLFALHPLQASSADYVINRSTLLAAIGSISAVLLLLKARDSGPLWLAPAALAWWMGLSGKETAAAAPLLGWIALKTVPGRKGRRLELALLAMLAAQGVLYAKILASAWRGPLGTADFARTQLWVVPSYLRLALFPWPMSVFHHLPDVSSWRDPRLAWAALAWAAGLAFWLGLGRSRPWLLLAGGWWLAALLPEASIVPLEDRMTEHRAYLAMAAPALAAGWLLTRIRIRWAAAALAALLLGTMGRAAGWAEPRLLWAEACRVSPGSPKAWINLGQVESTLGRMPEAMRWTWRALALRPGDSEAVLNLGAFHSDLGRSAEAASFWSQLPDHPVALCGLGNLYQEAGRLAEAEAAYRRSVQLSGAKHLRSVNALGTLLAQQGRRDEAKALFEEALLRKPSYLEARMNLGLLLQEMGREEEAEQELEEAARLAPDDPLVRLGLGRLLQSQAERAWASLPTPAGGSAYRPEALVRQLDEALKGNPIDPGLREARSRLEEAQRLWEEAMQSFQHVLLFPSSTDRLITGSRNRLMTEALERMGAIETMRGNLERGCECLRQALALNPGNERIRSFLKANGGLSPPAPTEAPKAEEKPFLPSDLSPGPGPSAR